MSHGGGCELSRASASSGPKMRTSTCRDVSWNEVPHSKPSVLTCSCAACVLSLSTCNNAAPSPSFSAEDDDEESRCGLCGAAFIGSGGEAERGLRFPAAFLTFFAPFLGGLSLEMGLGEVGEFVALRGGCSVVLVSDELHRRAGFA